MARLHSRIYLHFLGVLLVVGLATSAVFALGTRGAFQREVADRMARHVAALAAERIADPPALALRLEQVRADLGVDATVRALDGRPIAAAGRAQPPLSAADAGAIRAGRVVSRARGAWLAAAPVRDPASGAIVAVVQAALHRRFGPEALLGPALAVISVLLVVAVATRPLARRISRPLERLTEAARRLGAGDLAARAPAGAPGPGRGPGRAHRADELAELTRAFNDMAERVERMVRGEQELLANVSHELRSPLARIRVALELLPRAEGAETRFRDLERDLADLERLIDDVLAAARLGATGLPAHLGAVSAAALLAELAERAALDPATAALPVRVDADASIRLIADEGLLRRALWNLVENAGKYGAAPVVLRAARAGDRVELSVEDAGPGIPPAERARVLDPFYRGTAARAADAAPVARGVGLGLTLARRVAEAHGGEIAIGLAGDGPGGCRVTLVLPASPPAAASSPGSATIA